MKSMLKIRYWTRYKRLLEFPSETKGIERVAGMFLYLVCLVIAALLMYLYLALESENHTVNFDIKSSNMYAGIEHQIPDQVFCPSMRKNHQYDFEVGYNEVLIKALKIPIEQINSLTSKYNQTCNKARCGIIEGNCKESFEYGASCYKMAAHFAKVNMTSVELDLKYRTVTTRRKFYLAGYTARILSKALEHYGGWTLHMLFLSLISEKYPLWDEFKQEMNKNFTREIRYVSFGCWYYTSDPKLKARGKVPFSEQCLTSLQSLWVGNTLCSARLGERFGKAPVTFFGFMAVSYYARAPTRYWIGSLKTQKLSWDGFATAQKTKSQAKEFQYTSLTSSVAHYSMVSIVDQTSGKLKCAEQPLIRGYESPCDNQKNRVLWYYILHYQQRQFIKAWFYPKERTTITKTNVFTAYSKFQYAAGIFGCLIGLSAMSLIEFMLTALRYCVQKNNDRFYDFLKAVGTVALVVVMVWMTYVDLESYFQSRWARVFVEEKIKLQTPVMRVCQERFAMDRPGFINVSRFYDFDVSPGLYQFVRFWAFHSTPGKAFDKLTNDAEGWRFKVGDNMTLKHIDWMFKNWNPPLDTRPVKFLGRKWKTCYRDFRNWDGPYHLLFAGSCVRRNETEVKILYDRLLMEFDDLSKKIGSDGTLADFFDTFKLDPQKLIKRCSLWGHDVLNCGQYASYRYEQNKAVFCLELAIPDDLFEDHSPGFRNALEVVIDNEQWREHSDLNVYVGPGLEKERRLYKDDLKHCMVGQGIKYYEYYKYRNPNWSHSPKAKFCQRDTIGWRFAFTTPTPSEYDSGIRLPWARFVEDRSYVFNIKPGFVFENGSTTCTKAPICQYPQFDFRAVMKGVQMVRLCGCATCFNRNADFFKRVKQITGAERKCCTYKNIARCVQKFYKGLVYDERKRKYKHNFALWGASVLPSQPLRDRQEIHDLRRNAKPSDFKRDFENYEQYFDNSTKTQLAKFARQCYKKPCEAYSLSMQSYAETEVKRKGETTFTLFYSSDDTVGIKTIDRLEFTQFFATFACGYSISVGVSLIGIFEIAFLAVKNCLGGANTDVSLAKVIHGHLIKALGVAFKTKSEETAVAPGGDGISEEPGSSSQQPVISENRSGQEDGRIAMPKIQPMKSVLGSKADQPGPSQQENSSGEPGESQESIERNAEVSVENTQGYQALMSTALLVMVAMTVVVIVFFLRFTGNIDYNADMIDAPTIQKPSVLLCVSRRDDLSMLEEGVAAGKCTVSAKPSPCPSVFSKRLTLGGLYFCLMKDNTHDVEKINPELTDLVLEVKRSALPRSLKLAVQSFNETVISEVVPYVTWSSRDKTIEYNAELRRTFMACTNEIKKIPCPRCPQQYKLDRDSSSVCCEKAGEVVPSVFEEKACEQSIFTMTTSGSLLKPSNASSALSVKAGRSTLFFYFVDRKYSAVGWLSLVGGFIGAFVELTILNLVAAVAIGLVRVVQRKPVF